MVVRTILFVESNILGERFRGTRARKRLASLVSPDQYQRIRSFNERASENAFSQFCQGGQEISSSCVDALQPLWPRAGFLQSPPPGGSHLYFSAPDTLSERAYALQKVKTRPNCPVFTLPRWHEEASPRIRQWEDSWTARDSLLSRLNDIPSPEKPPFGPHRHYRRDKRRLNLEKEKQDRCVRTRAISVSGSALKGR